MSLIGSVSCDCVEKGLLRIPHPYPHLLKVDEIVGPFCDSPEVEHEEAHREWWESCPCSHEDFQLAGGQIGNLFMVEWMRRMFQHSFAQPAETFPIL